MTYNEPNAEDVRADFSSSDAKRPIARVARPTGERVSYDDVEESSSEESTRERFDSGDTESEEPLLTSTEQGTMRSRWRSIQEKFVDDPALAVESADELVGEAIQRLSEIFRDTRERLEEGWGKDEDSTSTEELRQALRRYRTFFDRILAV